MAWLFDKSKGLEPIPGLPVAADDDAFEAAVAAYEGQFDSDQAGAVKASGLYKHMRGSLASLKAKSAAAEETVETPAGEQASA